MLTFVNKITLKNFHWKLSNGGLGKMGQMANMKE